MAGNFPPLIVKCLSFFLILDYFLPLSTKLNKVEFDIYLNKTKAFGAIAPSSVAFHKRLEHFTLAKKVKVKVRK